MLLQNTKVLVVNGPTATGKTNFALQIAKELGGELVSADSRQVYIGRDIINGKDLPLGSEPQNSNLKWRDRYLNSYEVNGIKLWLLDVVYPNEDFNVSFWKECADLVITDILKRHKLPIVVGGTGLYIKSLFDNLSQISIPPNEELRKRLANKSAKYLFSYLNNLDQIKAASLNNSDKNNPRRLIRAIEISLSEPKIDMPTNFNFLQIGLTAPKEVLFQRVNKRIDDRIIAGAVVEDLLLVKNPAKWQQLEHDIIRHQLTWFKKAPNINWFDVNKKDWNPQAISLVKNWYNNGYATQD